MGSWGDFCTYCGVEMSGDFPRQCANGHFTYASPVTVGIALQPVLLNGRMGILAVQRNINPYKGGYALPGGFVDPGELSKPAAVRELFEETNIRSSFDDTGYFSEATGGSHNPADLRKHNMYFYVMPVLDKNKIDLYFTNNETQGLKILFLSEDKSFMQDEDGNRTDLCFNTHHEAALDFLRKQNR